jgi:predicted transcriptional regulator
MPNEIIIPDPNRIPSFEEFREIILQYDKKAGLMNWAANSYGRIPRLIRVLNNFDPTGIWGAIDQLLAEKTSEREQENILRAIYVLAMRVWNIESKYAEQLPEEKFQFLYLIYQISDANIYSYVGADDIQNLMNLSQDRIISIGQHLQKNGFIKFNSWAIGIQILHAGIVKIETELLDGDKIPNFVDENEIVKIKNRKCLRFILLQYLFEYTGENTFAKILHEELADKCKLDHQLVITQLLPYLANEGWAKIATADSVTITEDGIDLIKGLQNN